MRNSPASIASCGCTGTSSQPVQKLVRKTCHSARVHRVYDRAQPPYQRLVAAGVLTAEQQVAHEALYQSLI